MKRRTKGMLLALIFIPASLLGIDCSAEDTAKNWDYYAAMDDYDVYYEYCQVNGIEVSEILPDSKDLPCYDTFVYRNRLMIDNMTVVLNDKNYTDEAEQSHREDASYYGFPEKWIVQEDEALRIDNLGGIVSFRFCPNTFESEDITSGIVNGYRIQLAILNSEFGKEYPIKEIRVDLPCDEIIGDFNGDGVVNASDASIILIYAAEHGAGKFAGTFEEYLNR